MGKLFTDIKENKADMKTVYLYIGLSIGILVFVALFIFIFIGKLFMLHAWLCHQNLTFYENLKEKWKGLPWKNPFNKDLGYNCKRLLCTKRPDAHFKIFLKNHLTTRKVNEDNKDVIINYTNNNNFDDLRKSCNSSLIDIKINTNNNNITIVNNKLNVIPFKKDEKPEKQK